MFFIRAAFWLTVVVFLLPQAPHSSEPREGNIPPQTNSGDELVSGQQNAAKAAELAVMSTRDLAHFCDRNEQACTVAAELANQFKTATIDAYRNAGAWLAVLHDTKPAESLTAEI
jgi:hypothetical protein